ncbi:MAG: SDR family NAD(P)-dependent oxidoreductase [Bacteroidota bacterium]|nr:SDR family NAD(P)-dependent oxidoreductase [Bacteroidota bacterium]
MNTVLVTGGAGFIGSNLCDRLLGLSYRVICVDNFDDFYATDIKKRNLSNCITHNNFKLYTGDIRDAAFLDDVFTGNSIDIVIHLASKAGVRPSIANPQQYYDVNVNGTLSLLETMRNHRCTNLIFSSSSSVYGNNKKVPFSETDNVDFPISPYAASKKAAELLCHTYYHLHGFNIFCLRLFTVYGPRQRPDLAIHKFVRSISDNQIIPFYGDGSSERDYTHVFDICDGILSAISHLKGFEIFNLGGSQTTSLKNLVTLIEELLGKKAIIQHLPAQKGDVVKTYADISKSRQQLGYSPKFDMRQGLINYVDWLKSNDL